MNSRIVTAVLAIGAASSVALLAYRWGLVRLPDNQQGYSPTQPIAFSHRLHAGELRIACLYCHFDAQVSRHAGIPPADVCMNCHKFVTATLGALRAEDVLAAQEKRKPRPLTSPEIAKLYDAVQRHRPIAWIKVDNLPDFVHFDHRPHVSAGVDCTQCHGPVQTMERVGQVQAFNMGWCVACHRQVNQTGVAGKQVHASTDCMTCHY